MNKKLLFGIMSLAALAACTNDDFESQNVIAEQTSPIQFELINGNDASMRASWNSDKNAVSFSAKDGDLFTLYHGGTCANVNDPLTAFENATYKATNDEGTATLTTPSMIKAGKAVMVWPADTAFLSRDYYTDQKFHISIPAEQTDYVNQLPYVSDLINITAYNAKAPYNTEGYNRKYPIFMRQMGSLLTLKADYVGNDKLKKLEEGEDAIKAITVDKITLSTGTGTEFTKMIPVKFTAENANWPTAASIHHAWEKVTAFDVNNIVTDGQTTTLSAEGESLLKGNQGAKIVMLPQKEISETTPSAEAPTGVVDAAVVVDTYYGRVVVAAPGVTVDGSASKYTTDDIKDAWIRYISESAAKKDYEKKATSPTTSADADQNGKYRTTSNIAAGMMQTINWFSSADRKSTNTTVKNEPVGGLLTRYVKVDLSKLDMSKLHVKDDKQLRDVARVWQKMNLDDVTVFLDGDANHEFKMSQKTIKVINDINDGIEGGTKSFKVKPCTITTPVDESCTTIVITGGDNLQDIAFIEDNGGTKVNVVLNADETWKWNVDSETKVASIKVQASAVKRFINKGTILNNADATLKTLEKNGTPNNVPLRNEAIWNITGGKLFVQFTVTNNGGTVNISKGAEYRQDGNGHVFYNWASTLPKRITKAETESIGLVNNYGVFATVNNGTINNYGLIEHKDVDAKTYISANDNGGAGFGTEFKSNNKIGRINLPYSNRNEDNISVNAALNKGFVSVTVTAEELAKAGVTSTSLDASVVGEKVNYIIVNSGITEISKVKSNILYLEIADADKKEIAWNVTENTKYDGLIVLSPVNIKQGTTINVVKGNFLGADMYVGGTFTFNGAAVTKNSFKSYYGDTSDKFATLYVTY